MIDYDVMFPQWFQYFVTMMSSKLHFFYNAKRKMYNLTLWLRWNRGFLFSSSCLNSWITILFWDLTNAGLVTAVCLCCSFSGKGSKSLRCWQPTVLSSCFNPARQLSRLISPRLSNFPAAPRAVAGSSPCLQREGFLKWWELSLSANYFVCVEVT